MGQWCFAAKNSRVVSKAALIASGLLMIFAITPIFFGVLAAQQGITVPQGSSVLIEAVQALTNPLVTTCIMFAVLMALISTANSLLCSVSSIIVCDFSKTNKTVLFSKCITLSVGLFALLFSFMFSHIVPILMFSYELAVCVLFVPVVMAVWSKNPKKNAALLSMTIGGISFILLQIWETTFPRVLISLSLSLIAFLLYQKLSLQKSE
jgi:SSS family solute:Na+ symporter